MATIFNLPSELINELNLKLTDLCMLAQTCSYLYSFIKESRVITVKHTVWYNHSSLYSWLHKVTDLVISLNYDKTKYLSPKIFNFITTGQIKRLQLTFNNMNYPLCYMECFINPEQYHCLEYLSLEHTDIMDLSMLVPIKSLRCLNISYTKISEIPKLDQLQELYAKNTRIKDISNISNIECLDITKTSVIDVSCLKKIKLLIAENTQISDISMLITLEAADISRTNVTNIPKLPKLRKLLAYCNKLNSLEFSDALETLELQMCSLNIIYDCSRLYKIKNVCWCNNDICKPCSLKENKYENLMQMIYPSMLETYSQLYCNNCQWFCPHYDTHYCKY